MTLLDEKFEKYTLKQSEGLVVVVFGGSRSVLGWLVSFPVDVGVLDCVFDLAVVEVEGGKRALGYVSDASLRLLEIHCICIRQLILLLYPTRPPTHLRPS